MFRVLSQRVFLWLNYRNPQRKKPRIIVFDRSTTIYTSWLSIITMAVLYNIYLIIARASFVELQTKYQTLWFSLDYICDFIYILDIFVQFRTGKANLESFRVSSTTENKFSHNQTYETQVGRMLKN